MALQKIPSDDYKKRLAAYNEYLSEHPEGKYRKDVKKLKEKQSEVHYKYVKKEIIDCERNKDLAPCIDLCSMFITDYSILDQMRGDDAIDYPEHLARDHRTAD